MRLVIDTFEFGTRYTPKFNTISISGYHIREAGSTAIQELAFTLRDGIEYVEWGMRRGLALDDFAPRLSFFFNAHNDFFEEMPSIAPRAASGTRSRPSGLAPNRRGPGAALPCADRRVLAHRAATAQQRCADGAPGAGRSAGGTQSLHTNSLDEAWALRPSLPPRWPCARSRSLPTRAEWPTRWTRLADLTSSKL